MSTNNNNSLINLQHVVKRYPMGNTTFTALEDITLSIGKGEFTGIVGPSGSGKTTLLNIIGSLDSPSEGSAEVLGQFIENLSHKEAARLRNHHLGFIFQTYNLLPVYTVFENVELPLLYLKVSATERKRRVNEVLERMEIIHRKNHFPQQLSGGQQQRVAVSRAIVSNPKLILADEPTGNLDSKNGDEVMRMLSDLNDAGTTVIMVTHSPAYAEYGSRVVHLFDGHIVTENFNEKFHV